MQRGRGMWRCCYSAKSIHLRTSLWLLEILDDLPKRCDDFMKCDSGLGGRLGIYYFCEVSLTWAQPCLQASIYYVLLFLYTFELKEMTKKVCMVCYVYRYVAVCSCTLTYVCLFHYSTVQFYIIGAREDQKGQDTTSWHGEITWLIIAPSIPECIYSAIRVNYTRAFNV